MPGDSDTTLALLDRDLAAVPLELATRRGPSTTTLNLTENRIRGAGSNLHLFTAVATLVLDKNGIESLEGFPRMPSVTTLWLNQNAVRLLIITLHADVASPVFARSIGAAPPRPRPLPPASPPPPLAPRRAAPPLRRSPTSPSSPTRWRRASRT